MSNIEATLAERGKRYGEFAGHAQITQSIKALFHSHAKWLLLANDQKEALEMIAHKIGRIFNGDPDYDDSWVDIAGYAKLVADRLNGPQEPKKPVSGFLRPGASVAEALVGSAKPESWQGKAKAPDAACQCSGCKANRLLAEGLTLDELGAMVRSANFVVVRSLDDEQT